MKALQLHFCHFLRVSLLGLVLLTAGCSEENLTSPGLSGRESYERRTGADLDFTGVDQLSVGTENGTISIRPQESFSTRLGIRVTVQAPTANEAARIAELVQVDVQAQDGKLTVLPLLPDPIAQVTIRVDLDFACPSGLGLELAAVNGEISVIGMKGGLRAELTNGRIAVAPARDVRGAIWVRAVNGDIEAELPEGVYSVQATTVSGCIGGEYDAITLDRCGVGRRSITMGAEGRLPCELRSVTGDIQIRGY